VVPELLLPAPQAASSTIALPASAARGRLVLNRALVRVMKLQSTSMNVSQVFL
jgi:hypothetical protein